jgi:hypothetical protein
VARWRHPPHSATGGLGGGLYCYLVDNDIVTIEPTLEKQDEWVALCEEQANETLLIKTESWYMGANIEGKPRRLLGYLGVGDYRDTCEAVKSSGYAGFNLH